MAKIPDVVAGETIAASWGNLIRDRTVTPFVNAAERDSSIVTPAPGMACFLVSTGDLLVYADPPGVTPAGWYPPWTTAWGMRSRTVIPPKANVAIGAQALTGGGFTLPLVGRRYLITICGMIGAAGSDLTLGAQPATEPGPIDAARAIVGSAGVAGRQYLVSQLHYLAATAGSIAAGITFINPQNAIAQFEAGVITVADVGPV